MRWWDVSPANLLKTIQPSLLSTDNSLGRKQPNPKAHVINVTCPFFPCRPSFPTHVTVMLLASFALNAFASLCDIELKVSHERKGHYQIKEKQLLIF